jgi:P-type Cu+ transporter
VLLTGDNHGAARAIAMVGIDEVIDEVLGGQTVEAVRDLQRRGRVVAMVGDGSTTAAGVGSGPIAGWR